MSNTIGALYRGMGDVTLPSGYADQTGTDGGYTDGGTPIDPSMFDGSGSVLTGPGYSTGGDPNQWYTDTSGTTPSSGGGTSPVPSSGGGGWGPSPSPSPSPGGLPSTIAGVSTTTVLLAAGAAVAAFFVFRKRGPRGRRGPRG